MPKTSTLTLAGQTFELVYDFNLIAESEEDAGCNLLEALVNLHDLTAMQLRGLLYAAIISPTPRPSILQVGALLEVDAIGPVTSALAKAYNLEVKTDPIPAPGPALVPPDSSPV